MKGEESELRVHRGPELPDGLPSPDGYFLPDYGRAASVADEGERILPEAIDGAWQIPLIVRELVDGAMDAISPTYSGAKALNGSGSLTAIAGFIDDDPSPADLYSLEALGSKIVGSIHDLARRTEAYSAVAVRSAVDREMIAGLLANSPVTYPVLVHPQATIGCDVHLSEGVVIAPGGRLSTNIQVGRHVQIDQNAAIGHDCDLGDFSRLNPQACVSGAVTIGRRAMIGANAIVLQGLKVGDDARVGAGAVVTNSVDPDTTVMGVPAR
ncbi:MAG: acetyltransferase [Nitrospiraceae bacterium]|nr:acetyltransferase [Nitrospiraceae bacterium]